MTRNPRNADKRHAPLRRRPRLVAIVGLLLATPLLVELILRIPGLGPASYQPRRFEPDGRVPFIPYSDGKRSQVIYDHNVVFSSVYDKSGDTRGYFGADGRVIYRLNQFGMRGPDVSFQKPPNGFRVLCLGDSITFGEGVREEDTYCAQLEKRLSSALPQKKVEVINQGVQGYGTKEELGAFMIAGRAFRPDAVVVGFFLNDATDFGETIRQNDARNKAVELSGLARYSKIAEFFDRRSRASTQQTEFFESVRRSFGSANWEDCKGSLLQLRGESTRKNSEFKLLVVIFPVLWNLNDSYPLRDIHELLHRSFKELGCEYLDLLDVFNGLDAESLWVHPTDQHPNEIAHRLAAEAIARRLQPTTK